jgi:hypothetical protein
MKQTKTDVKDVVIDMTTLRPLEFKYNEQKVQPTNDVPPTEEKTTVCPNLRATLDRPRRRGRMGLGGSFRAPATGNTRRQTAYNRRMRLMRNRDARMRYLRDWQEKPSAAEAEKVEEVSSKPPTRPLPPIPEAPPLPPASMLNAHVVREVVDNDSESEELEKHSDMKVSDDELDKLIMDLESGQCYSKEPEVDAFFRDLANQPNQNVPIQNVPIKEWTSNKLYSDEIKIQEQQSLPQTFSSGLLDHLPIGDIMNEMVGQLPPIMIAGLEERLERFEGQTDEEREVHREKLANEVADLVKRCFAKIDVDKMMENPTAAMMAMVEAAKEQQTKQDNETKLEGDVLLWKDEKWIREGAIESRSATLGPMKVEPVFTPVSREVEIREIAPAGSMTSSSFAPLSAVGESLLNNEQDQREKASYDSQASSRKCLVTKLAGVTGKSLKQLRDNYSEMSSEFMGPQKMVEELIQVKYRVLAKTGNVSLNEVCADNQVVTKIEKTYRGMYPYPGGCQFGYGEVTPGMPGRVFLTSTNDYCPGLERQKLLVVLDHLVSKYRGLQEDLGDEMASPYKYSHCS